MVRQLVAFAVVFGMSTASVSAQAVHPQLSEVTINAASADVHKYPSIASPIIGKVPRGTVLSITRNLGSWVEVPWPDSDAGIAFVHVNAGTIVRRSIPQQTAAAPPPPPPSEVARPLSPTVSAEQGAGNNRPIPGSRTYVALPSHTVGLGARMSTSATDLGATVRTWWDRVGLQVEVSRSAITGIQPTDRFTFVRFAPTMLFSVANHVSDSLWIRPYVGGGASFYRAALQQTTVAESSAHTGRGIHALGGIEGTFAGLPQLTLSADATYRPWQTSFTEIESKKFGISLSAHWYIK